MTNIYIKYNPYTVKTEFKINNELLRQDSRLMKQSEKRLQYWLEENEYNWKGIVEELHKASNSDELNITFEGRKIDFEDLQLTVNKNKKNFKIELKHIETKNDSDILKEIDKVFKEFEKGPIAELKSEEMKKTYEEVKSSKFKVNVIATMSSGKSTLINSFIGYELLPSENMACTATIARIKDNNDLEKFVAVCRDENEDVVYEGKDVTLEDIQGYNKDEKVTYIDIEGPIPNISSEKMNLLLMDTPGPNNSRNKEHGELTETIIDDKNEGLVLYVINATQFGINDDSELLGMISDAMKRGGKQSKDRFVFAINKCDEFDCEKGESIKNLLKEVTEYLSKYGIEEPNLFPVSAQTAKLIRMHKNSIELTRKEKKDLEVYEDFNDLEGYHFEKFATLSESSRKNLELKIAKTKTDNDDYEEALIHTGIPAIEETVSEYLEKYAYPIKIKEAVKKFLIIIEEKSMMAKLDSDIAADDGKFNEIREQIKAVKEKLAIGEGARKIKEKIDSFNIDASSFRAVSKEIATTLLQVSKKFSNKESIEKDIADREITKFKNEVVKLEKEYKIKLKRAIKNSVISQGENLVNEYQQYIYTLKGDLNISNFNFEKVREIQEVNIDDVDDLVKKHTTKKNIYEDREVENRDKKWYKPWTWSESSHYTVTEKVGEKEMIDVSAVIDTSMGIILNQTDRNVEKAKTEVENQVLELKEYFKKELDKLGMLIIKTVDDLDNKTKSEKEISERAEKNKRTKIWLEDVVVKVNSIMDM
jgi:hypothetical protein